MLRIRNGLGVVIAFAGEVGGSCNGDDDEVDNDVEEWEC